MDNETYEQVFIPADAVGDASNFMKENIDVSVQFFNGNPIGIDLPTTVNLEVVKSEPGRQRRYRHRRHQTGRTGNRVCRPGAALY